MLNLFLVPLVILFVSHFTKSFFFCLFCFIPYIFSVMMSLFVVVLCQFSFVVFYLCSILIILPLLFIVLSLFYNIFVYEVVACLFVV